MAKAAARRLRCSASCTLELPLAGLALGARATCLSLARSREHPVQPDVDVVPGAHVRRLLLHPPHLLGVGVPVEHGEELRLGPRVELLDPHDRGRRAALRRARPCSSCAILPVQRITRLHGVGRRRGRRARAGSAPSVNSASGERVAGMRRYRFGVKHTSGTRRGDMHLAAQHVEVLRRGGRVDDAEVVLGATARGSARCGRWSAPGPGPRSRGGGAARGCCAGPTCPRRRR